MCMHFMRLHRFLVYIFPLFRARSVSFAMSRLPFCSFWSLVLSALCSSVGITSRITSTSPSLMSYLMCAFPYLPLAVPVMLTSVVLASSVVISCMML